MFNLNLEEEESEKLWEEVIFNTEMKMEKFYHLQAIKNQTQYIFDFLNDDKKFKKIFEHLSKWKLLNFSFRFQNKSLFQIISKKKVSNEVFKILFDYFVNNIPIFNEIDLFMNYINFLTNNSKYLNDDIKNYLNVSQLVDIKSKAQEKNEKDFINKCNEIDNKYDNKNMIHYTLNQQYHIGDLIKDFIKLTPQSIIFKEFLQSIFSNENNFSDETLNFIFNTIISLIYDQSILFFINKLLLDNNSNRLMKVIISNLENIYKKLKLNDSIPFENNKYNIYSIIFQLNDMISNYQNHLQIIQLYLSFIQGLKNSNYLRETFQYFIFENSQYLFKDSYPQFISKNDLLYLSKFQKNSNKNKDEVLIVLLCYLLNSEKSLKYYEDIFLQINSEQFTPYYNILKEISSININYTFECNFADDIFKNNLQTFSKCIIPNIFSYLCNFIQKMTNKFNHFIFILFKILSLTTNLEKYEEIMEKEIKVLIKFNKLLDDKNYDIELQKRFIENFIINFNMLKIDNKKKYSEDDVINSIINFIKISYKNKDFFNIFISNRDIIQFINLNFKKENEDNLLYQYIKLNIELNTAKKQKILSFIPPNLLNSFENPSNILFSDYFYFISFNPFTFILYNQNLDKEEVLQGYKSMFNEIVKDNRIIEISKNNSSKYVQFDNELQYEIEKTSIDNLNILLKNLKIIQKDYIEFNDLLKNNKSFLDAFFYILYHYLKDKTKNKKLIEFIEILIKFPLLEDIQINIKFIEIFLIIAKNNFTDIMNNFPKEYIDIFYNENFFNLISNNKIDLEIYQLILEKLISSLIEYKDINLFDNFIKIIFKNTKENNNFSVLLNTLSKNNFYSNLFLTYSIFSDDLNLFKLIMDKLNFRLLGVEGKDFLLGNIIIKTFYEFSFIKKRKNKFSIFIDNYNETIYFYLCLIASADNILKYINENYISMNQIKDIYKNINDVKYNLKKSIFLSKNLDYILEFNDILQFDSFDNNDYYLISTNYNNIKYYNTYIKAFSSLLNGFSFVKLFMNCIEYSNDALADILFDNFTNDEKEQLLDEKIKGENILQLIVSKNKYNYLKDLIPALKSKKKYYNHLLFIILNSDKNIENENKDEKYDKDILPKFIYDDYLIESKETPLYYSIKTQKFECFSLLLDLYPKAFIQYLFVSLELFSPRFFINYIEYINNKENKLKIKQFNSNLYIISEYLSLICNLSDIQNIRIYQSLFGFLLSNEDYFYIDSKDIKIIMETNNLKISYPILYILIHLLKIYPDISILELFMNVTQNYNYKINENNILYILYLMSKEGKTILPVDKYLDNNFDKKYLPESIDKIKEINGYEKLIENKNNNYKYNEKILSNIENDPLKILSKCGNGYFRIGYIIFKEYNLFQQLLKLKNDERILTSYILQQFNFLFIYQFYNYDYIKIDIGDLGINAYERMNKFLNYKKEEKKKEESKNEQNNNNNNENNDNDDDLNKNLNENNNDDNNNKFENNNDFNGKMDDNIFDRFLISIFDKTESNVNIDYTIITLSYFFELTELINQGINQEKESQEKFLNYINKLNSHLNLVLQKLIHLLEDENISKFFASNNYENIFNELDNNLDIKSIITNLYNGFNSVFEKNIFMPKYLKNYYEDMIEKSIKEKLEKISEIEIPYKKYFHKFQIYIFYILSFLDNLSITNLKENYIEFFNTLRRDNKNLIENKLKNDILEIEKKWFNSINIEYKNINDENEAKEIIDKSYNNFAISLNKILNLEEEVKCEIELPYFYDINNLIIYETTSKLKISDYIERQFSKIINLITFLLNDKLLSYFLIVYPNKFILNTNDENDKLKENENKYKDAYEHLITEINLQEFKEIYIHIFLFINCITKKLNLEELLFDKSENYLINILREKYGYYKDIIEEIKNNKFLFDELNNFFLNENNYGFSSISNFINNKIKSVDYSEIKIKRISNLYPEINKFDYFLEEIFLSQVRLNQRLNKMFEEILKINLDCNSIFNLLNDYIDQNLIYEVNNQFNESIKKDILNTIFKNQIFYRIFNIDNSFILSIIVLVDYLNYKIREEKKENLIKYTIHINEKLNKGNTIEYKEINDLNNIFEIENIECHVKKYNKKINDYDEIEIYLTLNMNLFKFDGDDEKFILSLKKIQIGKRNIDNFFEKWLNEDMINKLYNNIQEEGKKKSEEENDDEEEKKK